MGGGGKWSIKMLIFMMLILLLEGFRVVLFLIVVMFMISYNPLNWPSKERKEKLTWLSCVSNTHSMLPTCRSVGFIPRLSSVIRWPKVGQKNWKCFTKWRIVGVWWAMIAWCLQGGDDNVDYKRCSSSHNKPEWDLKLKRLPEVFFGLLVFVLCVVFVGVFEKFKATRGWRWCKWFHL